MQRRQFLVYGAAWGSALALGADARAQTGSAIEAALTIEPVDAEMIDGVSVFMVVFFSAGGPRPVLRATEGDSVTLTIRNNDSRAHGFAIPGVPGASIASILPGREELVRFTAPRGGTYLYLDPTLAPVNRLLGLHGAFVVAPREPMTSTGVVTPFSRAALTPAIANVFEALGASYRFPGNRWTPDRERVWVFSQIDPVMNARVDAGAAIDPRAAAATFHPRYFTLNGKSGFDASHDPASKAEGYIGEPLILRVLNAGLATHAPHIHGNHLMELSGVDASGAQIVRENLIELDTWTMAPLDRKDMLLPFERPEDIPDAAFPLREEPYPLKYPMHCHIEMSQTAGGGNYPQGLITDWEILGPPQTPEQRARTREMLAGTAQVQEATFDNFGCDVFGANPPTPDRVEPDVRFELGVRFGLRLRTPDSRQLEVWRFDWEDRPRTNAWPSPTLRVRQGQVVHSSLYSRSNTHTIHHHGIDPTPFNDGVGHTSFEVEDRYTYQFQAREPGTYFYHCHKNTVLHFEMGMYGLLIVDPPEGPGTYVSGGARYDVEKAWVVDDFDPRWRQLNDQAGLCGEDAGLDRFNPRYFGISGAFAPNTMTDNRAVVRARAGQRILVRLLNASYGILRTTLGVDATVLGVDGRALGRSAAPWSQPFVLRAGQPFELTTAQRYDLLITPPRAGEYPARFEFLNWVTRAVQNNGRGVAATRIIVT